MGATAKKTKTSPPFGPRSIRFRPEEWERIQEAAARLVQPDGRPSTAADVVRSATLRLVRETLEPRTLALPSLDPPAA